MRSLFVAVLLLSTVFACVGCGGGTASTNQPTPTPTPIATPSPTPTPAGGIPVPANGAYFGAWVNPSGTVSPTATDIENYTETLESQVGRTFALHMHFYQWGS